MNSIVRKSRIYLLSFLAFVLVAFCEGLVIGVALITFAYLNGAYTISEVREYLVDGGGFFAILSLFILVAKLAGQLPSFTNRHRVPKIYITG